MKGFGNGSGDWWSILQKLNTGFPCSSLCCHLVFSDTKGWCRSKYLFLNSKAWEPWADKHLSQILSPVHLYFSTNQPDIFRPSLPLLVLVSSKSKCIKLEFKTICRLFYITKYYHSEKQCVIHHTFDRSHVRPIASPPNESYHNFNLLENSFYGSKEYVSTKDWWC